MATISASTFKVPSEFSRWIRSSKSKGRLEANKTSCAVPYSITAFSTTAWLPAWVTRTGIRTGMASGKNCANSATHEASAATERAGFARGFIRYAGGKGAEKINARRSPKTHGCKLLIFKDKGFGVEVGCLRMKQVSHGRSFELL